MGRMDHWIFIQCQERGSITWSGECLKAGRVICPLLWWEEGTVQPGMYTHEHVLTSDRAKHPRRIAELSNCPSAHARPGSSAESLLQLSQSVLQKALPRAKKHRLGPVQSFCQQCQRPTLSAPGRELARGQGCGAVSSAPCCNVLSEFKVGQNAFASVNTSFSLPSTADMCFYIKILQVWC